MKLTKLSLVAALAVSTAFAGGDIAPVEPVVEAPVKAACNDNTTINGKAVAYYLTSDAGSASMFDKDTSALGTAITLDVSHKITENFTANFTAVGYANLLDNYMESKETGAFFNVANITATFGDTTFVAGRQLLDTPMLGGFDWLLAPGAFEAYTLVNSSIENVTLVGSYVTKWRPNNIGDNFIDLTDVNDGNNWTLGAAYDDKTMNASLWYYNVDASDYTQFYVDAGYDLGSAKVSAQYVLTDYAHADDSKAFGLKASTSVAGYDLMLGYTNVQDNSAGFVGRDTLYASSWNTFASTVGGNSFKVEAAKEFDALSATASYAYYEYNQGTGTEDGHEFDLILGYGVTDCISADVVYSNTDFGDGENINALEVVATYKF